MKWVTHRREAEVLGDLVVVAVALLHLRLSGCEVATQEAERRAEQVEADRHCAFVSSRAAQTGFDRLHGNVPTNNYPYIIHVHAQVSWIGSIRCCTPDVRSVLRSHEDEEANANQLR